MGFTPKIDSIEVTGQTYEKQSQLEKNYGKNKTPYPFQDVVEKMEEGMSFFIPEKSWYQVINLNRKKKTKVSPGIMMMKKSKVWDEDGYQYDTIDIKKERNEKGEFIGWRVYKVYQRVPQKSSRSRRSKK